MGSVPGLGRSPGEGNGNTLQYSCLENPMDRGVWQAAVHGVSKSQTQLSMPVQLSPPMKEVKLTHPPSEACSCRRYLQELNGLYFVFSPPVSPIHKRTWHPGPNMMGFFELNFEPLACHLLSQPVPRIKCLLYLNILSLGFIGISWGKQSKLGLINKTKSLVLRNLAL